MARGARECRDCDQPIQFIEKNGRWIPVEPGTERRHRCQLDQECEACRKTFKGAPWMKTCPDCYRSGRTASSASQEPATPPRERERLKDDQDDDVPF